jgi:hypothetical protein
MTREQERIRTLFDQLMSAPLKGFPNRYSRYPKLEAPSEHGVYVIYGTRMKVLYVGRTYRGQAYGGGFQDRGAGGGLQRRLITQRQKIVGSEAGCKFRCLVVKNPRERALLEHYTIGFLCPKHVGTADKDKIGQNIMPQSN